jgi:hypothetical protein
MPQKTHMKAHSTDTLDYPSNLSMYEKDSLASEAKLAAGRRAQKESTFPKTKPERNNKSTHRREIIS